MDHRLSRENVSTTCAILVSMNYIDKYIVAASYRHVKDQIVPYVLLYVLLFLSSAFDGLFGQTRDTCLINEPGT